jgi:hypothetical protein
MNKIGLPSHRLHHVHLSSWMYKDWSIEVLYQYVSSNFMRWTINTNLKALIQNQSEANWNVKFSVKFWKLNFDTKYKHTTCEYLFAQTKQCVYFLGGKVQKM